MFSLVKDLPKGTKSKLLPVDRFGEIINNGPLGTLQNYRSYTPEDSEVWSLLYSRQRDNLEGIAYSVWLNSLDAIGLEQNRIPKLSEIAKKIHSLTAWQPVPISGFLSAHDYFSYIAKRQFPTVTSLRSKDRLEFIAEPDLFHDAFGHLPMHANPIFADFLELFGKTALKATTSKQELEMQRLYWFTVEYGLIRENGKIKVCGSGHMSGIKESRYSLTNAVVKKPFNLQEVVNQDFNPHILQPVLFILDSFDQLYEAMEVKASEFNK